MNDPDIARLDLERRLRRVIVLTRSSTCRSAGEQMAVLRTANHWMNSAMSAFDELMNMVATLTDEAVDQTRPMGVVRRSRR